MKKTILLLATILLLTSCGMQRFTIGATSGQTQGIEKRKQITVFYVIPLGRKQSFPMLPGATGYVITTKYKLLDLLVSGLTVGIVNMKSVKLETIK